LAEKYRIEFKTLQGQDCVIRFNFASHTGSSTTLKGGANPFVLREYNTDEKWFKPVRPMMAEIQILAEQNNVSIDTFLTDTDNEITVYFDFGTWTNYWIGWLMQDDFQEIWQYTNHILVLRASDGIGLLDNVPLQDNAGDELLGKYTPWDLIKYAMYQTPQTFTNSVVINNLFHTSMDDSSAKMPLDQCYIDVKTFQTDVPIQYESSLEVLNKINSSFNQTLFQYKGQWYIIRLEELYAPFSTNLRGFTNSSGGRTAFTKRYDVEIGSNSEMKFITPEVIRFINRTKRLVKTRFLFDEFEEIIDNESFSRGAFDGVGTGVRYYDLDYWQVGNAPAYSPVASASLWGRIEEFDGAGRLIDNYAYLTPDGSNISFIYSNPFDVENEEKLDISFDVKIQDYANPKGVSSHAYVLLWGDLGGYYMLDNDGQWKSTTSTFNSSYAIKTDYTKKVFASEYQSINITTQPIPEKGYVKLYLVNGDDTLDGTAIKRFKSLKVKVITYFNSFSDRQNIGIESIFEKDILLKTEAINQTYLDDGFSYHYKGNIFESDQETFTNKEWYRYRFKSTGEANGFRASNLIANWEVGRFNRNKFDANMFGLVWNDGTADQPLGLVNTVKLTEDDPNKVYGILNLKEINFSNSTWSATLVEIYDQYLDDDSSTVSKSLDTTTTAGTYNSLVYAKLTIVSAADFLLNSNQDQLVYNGDNNITVNFTARINGYINSNTSSPITITLRKNATILSTYTLAIPSNPYPFAANLDVSGISLTKGDEIYIQYSSNITQVQVTTGGIDTSYTITEPFNYDTYSDAVINN
jgi:hypothetical protein